MFDFLKRSPILEDARRARLKLSFFGQLMVFWLVYLIGYNVAALPATSYMMMTVFAYLLGLGEEAIDGMNEEELRALVLEKSEGVMQTDTYLLITLLSMAFLIVLAIVYCRFFERRPLSSMGLRRPFFRHYLLGLLGGGLMFLLLTGILLALGAVSFTRGSGSTGMILLFLLGFLIQGAAEEVLLRGYLMPSLANSTSPLSALLMSSILFALLHGSNTGISLLAYFNIFLFGLFLGILVLRTGSLFGAAAIHGAWNFLEGLIFGFPVSGTPIASSALVASLSERLALTSGGLFGPEGGYAATLVLIASLILVLYWPEKQRSGMSATPGATPGADDKTA